MPEMILPEEAGFLITHAEVASPLDFGYILTPEDAAKNFAACEDSIIFIGHTHFAGVFMEDESGAVSAHEPEGFQCAPDRRYIINPGSIGDPRTSDIVASYCIYDSDTANVEFRNVTFDIELYRQLHASSGLTSKPYFLRYLDGISSGDKQMKFPAVRDSEIRPTMILSSNNTPKTPNINLGSSPVAFKTTKKKNPVYLLVFLFLLIGGGVAAWMASQKADNAIELTQKNTSNSSNNKTPENEPEITIDQTIAKPTEPIEPIEPEIPEIAIKFPVLGRYVRISNARGPYLSLAEVEVHNQLRVISKGKKATQSSDYSPSMNASSAVDGNHQGDNPDLIAHTKADNPWWEVDLGKDLSIHRVKIWNREGHKYLRRLDGFTLQVFNEKRQVVYQTDNNPGATQIIEIN